MQVVVGRLVVEVHSQLGRRHPVLLLNRLLCRGNGAGGGQNPDRPLLYRQDAASGTVKCSQQLRASQSDVHEFNTIFRLHHLI